MTRIAPEARSWLAAIIALPLWRSRLDEHKLWERVWAIERPTPGL